MVIFEQKENNDNLLHCSVYNIYIITDWLVPKRLEAWCRGRHKARFTPTCGAAEMNNVTYFVLFIYCSPVKSYLQGVFGAQFILASVVFLKRLLATFYAVNNGRKQQIDYILRTVKWYNLRHQDFINLCLIRMKTLVVKMKFCVFNYESVGLINRSFMFRLIPTNWER